MLVDENIGHQHESSCTHGCSGSHCCTGAHVHISRSERMRKTLLQLDVDGGVASFLLRDGRILPDWRVIDLSTSWGVVLEGGSEIDSSQIEILCTIPRRSRRRGAASERHESGDAPDQETQLETLDWGEDRVDMLLDDLDYEW